MVQSEFNLVFWFVSYNIFLYEKRLDTLFEADNLFHARARAVLWRTLPRYI
jgi:hypothetical protein